MSWSKHWSLTLDCEETGRREQRVRGAGVRRLTAHQSQLARLGVLRVGYRLTAVRRGRFARVFHFEHILIISTDLRVEPGPEGCPNQAEGRGRPSAIADEQRARGGGHEEEGGIIHVMDVFQNPRSLVNSLAARRLLVHEGEHQPEDGQRESDHHRPEGAGLIRALPQHGAQVDRGDRWREQATDSLDVNEQLATLHFLNNGNPHYGGEHEYKDENAPNCLLLLRTGSRPE